MTTRNMIEAINDAHRVMMAADDSIIVYGEDVVYFCGVFRATAGLQDEFGRLNDVSVADKLLLALQEKQPELGSGAGFGRGFLAPGRTGGRPGPRKRLPTLTEPRREPHAPATPQQRQCILQRVSRIALQDGQGLFKKVCP